MGSALSSSWDLVVIGGGPAGFYCAITALENSSKPMRVAILERGPEPLAKVLISGGGRCNLTTVEEDPKKLQLYYPRGSKELLGPFYRFGPKDVRSWFLEKGLETYAEKDGRVFPVSNRSSDVAHVLISEAQRLGAELFCGWNALKIEKSWKVFCNQGSLHSHALVLATGGNSAGWKLLQNTEHTLVSPYPSLFGFRIRESWLQNLAGVSLTECQVQGLGKKTQGPLLFTHTGISGPAVLKLSSLAAPQWAQVQYREKIFVNWIPKITLELLDQKWEELKHSQKKQRLFSHGQFDLPKRLWIQLCLLSQIPEDKTWEHVSKQELRRLGNELCHSCLTVTGRETNRDEFVTGGGVSLKEVNFKTMESKLHPRLFFCGEALDIDALTGGFNFQAAWTTGWQAGFALSQKESKS